MNGTNPIETGLTLAAPPPPSRDRDSQPLDAYPRAIHLGHDLTQAGEVDREIGTAVAALTTPARDTTERVGQAAHEADRG